MRALNSNGDCVYELNLKGSENQLEQNHISLQACSGSLIRDCGNLQFLDYPEHVKYFVEQAARSLNYLDGYDIRPFVVVDEVDDTTVIFLELGDRYE